MAAEGWQEHETVNRNGRGVELYSPLHDYVYEAEGSFSGGIEAVADLRAQLVLHDAVKVGQIKLFYEE